MKLLRKILFATDFTTDAERAGTVAVELARRFQATIIPVHVLQEGDGPVEIDVLRQRMGERLSSVAGAMREAGANVAAAEVREGEVVEGISRAGDYHDVAVIVLGSGESTAPAGRHAGRIADRVTRYANKPVWVVKAGSHQPRHILCAVGCGEGCGHALHNAIHLARQFSAHLTILHVLEPAGRLKPHMKSAEIRREERLREFEALLAEYDFYHVDWQKVIVEGTPAEAIVAHAREHKADLILLYTPGRTGLARLLHTSTTAEVLRALPCSVLVVKQEDAVEVTYDEPLRQLSDQFHEGKELLEQGFPVEALQMFQKVLHQEPSFAPAWGASAEAQERIGNPEEANYCRRRLQQIVEDRWRMQVESEARRKAFDEAKAFHG